ncbi:MAG: DUF2396 family protein [Cyanobacteria bacterium]|nr:DUF2396 family protein [Cyanobacteriota bacterium]MEB3269668.1 DUF2396 family protein [Leptolyngbya sp.]
MPSAPDVPPSGSAASAARPLTLGDRVRCPLCRQGQLEALVLMDAFACDFCRHILAADLAKQQVQVVDSSQTMTWVWTGRGWRSLQRPDTRLTPLVWITAGLLLALPGGVIALSSYVLPPLNPSPGLTFGQIWACLTFACHAMIVLWLLAEHYQVPLYVALKVRLLRQRLS